MSGHIFYAVLINKPFLPGNVPLPLHQQMNVFDATVVGVVQSLWQVLLQVRLKVLLCFLTLKSSNTFKLTEGRRNPASLSHTHAAGLTLTVKFATTALASSAKRTMIRKHSGRGVFSADHFKLPLNCQYIAYLPTSLPNFPRGLGPH